MVYEECVRSCVLHPFSQVCFCLLNVWRQSVRNLLGAENVESGSLTKKRQSCHWTETLHKMAAIAEPKSGVVINSYLPS